MLGSEDVFRQYYFSDADRANLTRLGELLLPFGEQFAEAFADYLSSFPDMKAAGFAKVVGDGRTETMSKWLAALFCGTYDQLYIGRLERVGLTHVKRGIPIHWVTSSMSFKRAYLNELLEKLVHDQAQRAEYRKSLDKILDVNLDVLVSSYHEEQLRTSFLSERMDSGLIRLADRFAYGLNLVLVLALIGLGVGVVALFGTEVWSLVSTANLAGGIISALGTLLIIWVIVELVGTEIRYLRGERFGIEIFVAVALVSVIRELLIKTLSHEVSPLMPHLIAAILVLGIVYFLVSRSEFRR